MQEILNYSEKDFILDITIGDTVDQIDFRTALRINKGDLNKDLTQQPSYHAWYTALLTDQEDRLATRKRELDRHKSDISLQLRQGKLKVNNSDNKPLKLTEGGLNDYITLDNTYMAYQDDIQQLDTLCKKLKGLVAASSQRKDMLIQLGLLKRQEIDQMGLHIKNSKVQ